jgi:hypothetical protein
MVGWHMQWWLAGGGLHGNNKPVRDDEQLDLLDLLDLRGVHRDL